MNAYLDYLGGMGYLYYTFDFEQSLEEVYQEMSTRDKYGAMVTWTCYACFEEVRDHDNDGVGWCTGCRKVVDANGVPQERFSALRRSLRDREVEDLRKRVFSGVGMDPRDLSYEIFDISLVRDPLPGQMIVKKEDGWHAAR